MIPMNITGKRIITITLNPAIDRTVKLESLAYGQVNRAFAADEDLGGKGVNVARMLNFCGCNVMAAGLLGNDNIMITEALMNNERFIANWLPVPGKTRTNTKLVTISDKKTTDINEPGFDLSLISSKILDKLSAKISEWAVEYNVFVFAGSLPPGLPADTYGQLIRACKKAAPGCFIAVDTEGSPLEYALEAGADMIKPNLSELALLIGCCDEEYNNTDIAIKDCRNLFSKYPLKTILLSNGQAGSFLLTKIDNGNNKIEILATSALEVNPLSTTGAGDSLLAGYLSGISTGLDNKHSLAKGTACASLAVARHNWQGFASDMIEQYTETAYKLIREY